jgi:hypothetical protein
MLVSLSDADLEATSSKTMGIVENDILNGAEGFVVTEGLLAGLNTSTATAGQSVWLSSTAGGFVYGAPPAEPAHSVYLGIVTRVQSVNGEIFVKVQNGYELDELHDVFVGSAATGDLLVKTSTGWGNQSLATAGIATTSALTSGLAGKANSSHTHAASDITSGTLDSARMPAGSVLQVVTNRYAGRPGFNYSGATIISYLNTGINPKSANSLLIAEFTISGESGYNSVFRAYRDNNLITNSGYWGYNQEDGSAYSGIAVVPYDGDVASTPYTMTVRYFVPSYSTTPTTLQLAIQSSANDTQAMYLNRAYNSGGAVAYENMVSYMTITEVAQ